MTEDEFWEALWLENGEGRPTWMVNRKGEIRNKAGKCPVEAVMGWGVGGFWRRERQGWLYEDWARALVEAADNTAPGVWIGMDESVREARRGLRFWLGLVENRTELRERWGE